MSLFISAFPYALTFTAPILICALAGLVNTKSGIINIGLEGVMVVGTLASALTVSILYEAMGFSSVYLALILSAIAGGLFSLLLGIATIKFKADHIISGIAINLLATTLTLYIARVITGNGIIKISTGFKRIGINGLENIPLLGKLFFSQFYITTYFVIIISALIWYFFKYTKTGKNVSACGENPHSAASAGLNVEKIRYLSVFASGVLAGLGGGIIVLTYQSEFSGTVAGLGFLALTTLIFGKYKTINIIIASFFFGFAKTFASMASVNETLLQLNLPIELYNALPFILTMIVIAFAKTSNSGPKAAGQVYENGQR